MLIARLMSSSLGWSYVRLDGAHAGLLDVFMVRLVSGILDGVSQTASTIKCIELLSFHHYINVLSYSATSTI